MNRLKVYSVAVWGALLIGAPAFGAPDSVKEELPEWLKLDAEYRVRSVYINPMDLSGETVRRTYWNEQRLRVDLGFLVPDAGGVHIQLDMLDGVLFGDNGDYPGDPQSNSGVGVATRLPNRVGRSIGIEAGQDPVNPDSYNPTLRNVDPIAVNHAYGEVFLPFGLLRAGRMPYVDGASPAAHDGGRHNRWGASQFSHTADRILFATKLDEAVRVVASGGTHKVDTSLDNGVFGFVGYDWLLQDSVYLASDDLHQFIGGFEWRVKKEMLGDLVVEGLRFSSNVVHRWGKEFETEIYGFPQSLSGWFGPLYADLQLVYLTGQTREVSEGFAVLTNRDAALQDVRAMGAHSGLMVRMGKVDVGFDFEYASGDADPRTQTPLTTFSFAQDYNVGLLLFEHILAFESARSVAVGIENLSTLNASSFPLTEVSTHGRFTNAYAIFPQMLVRALEIPDHLVTLRVGALAAWPEYGVVDPVLSALAEDGIRIDDDLVNYHGGKPGDFYGVELDGQLEWTFKEWFVWTLEGAYLFPGNGLQDEHGHASNSFLFENRLTFIF